MVCLPCFLSSGDAALVVCVVAVFVSLWVCRCWLGEE